MRVVLEEIRALDTSKKQLRSFGLVVGTILVAIAVFVWWRRSWELGAVVQGLAGLGGGLVVLGLVLPTVLRPVYRVWMALAVVLGFVMTRVILTLTYYLTFVPIGLVLRLMGKDPMDRTLQPGASSYWIQKEYRDDAPTRHERYF